MKIDGDEIGSFTKEQLAEGINLATLPTPMAKQAAAVHKLTLQHDNTHFQRWRQIQVPLAESKSSNVQKAVKDLMPLSLNVHVVDRSIGQSIVRRIVRSVQSGPLQQRRQIIHVDNPKDWSWKRDGHTSYLPLSFTILISSAVRP